MVPKLLKYNGRFDKFRQRLAVDPNINSIVYFGARNGNGLWKSADFGKTWNKVNSFTNVGKSLTQFDESRSDVPLRHVCP